MEDSESEYSNQADVATLRVEYGTVTTSYISASSAYWSGYTAFFTLNTLFVTILGLSYSANSSLPNGIKAIVHYGIPAAGVLVSIIAIYTAYLIVKHQSIIINRGVELDRVLKTRSFMGLSDLHYEVPWATIAGCTPFMLMWAGAILFAV